MIFGDLTMSGTIYMIYKDGRLFRCFFTKSAADEFLALCYRGYPNSVFKLEVVY